MTNMDELRRAMFEAQALFTTLEVVAEDDVEASLERAEQNVDRGVFLRVPNFHLALARVAFDDLVEHIE